MVDSYWILALMSWMFLKEFDFSVICLNTSQIKTLPSRLESEKSSTLLLEFCGENVPIVQTLNVMRLRIQLQH